jgi:hypothetical protein
MSNRTAGSVSVTGGDVSASANGTTIVTITATGADVIITPTSDFDGDLDLAQMTVKQTDIAASSAFPGAEVMVDGDMEAATTAAYVAGNAATLTKETGTRTGGSGTKVLRVTRSVSNTPFAEQNDLIIGKSYEVSAWARSDGNATPRLGLGTTPFTGTTSTDWQQLGGVAIADSTQLSLQSVTSTGNEYTEWDDVSVTEANPLNGDHTAVAVGQAGQYRIPIVASYDGATSYTDIYSAELNSAFNPDAETLMIAARVANAGVWVDGAARVAVRIHSDANNSIVMYKNTPNNTLSIEYEAGSTLKSISTTTSTTDLFLFTMTWDKAEDAVKLYLNSTQQGTTQTGLGAWVGNLSRAVIGADSTTPALVWNGDLAYPTLYTRALTQPEIARIVRSMGIPT